MGAEQRSELKGKGEEGYGVYEAEEAKNEKTGKKIIRS
jgi:hypothetical protein